MITDRITSLPLVVAEKKGFFEDRGLAVDIRTCMDYKSILSLLEAGRIDAAELPVSTYAYDCFLKKSIIKRLYKGIYLSHSRLNFYSRNQFKPQDILFNKTYEIPVPSILSPERLYIEKFIEKYFPDKLPKLRFLEVPYYMTEKSMRATNGLGFCGDPLFYPFLNKFQSFYEISKDLLPEFESTMVPTTLLVFSGQFVKKFSDEVDGIIRSVKDAIELINSVEPNQTDEFISEIGLLGVYTHYRLGEIKQLLIQNYQKEGKSFHWKGDSKILGFLFKDHFFRGIKRLIQPEEVEKVLNFSEIYSVLTYEYKSIAKQKSFLNPGAPTQYSPSIINYRKQNYTRNLIVDAISISLDILEGNLESRLNIDDSFRIDNKVRIHLNNMLDYFQSLIFQLNERIIELENLNSILEIKLDRNAVNLQYSEEKYRYLFEYSSDPLIIVDADTGEIIESNLQFRLMSGYSRSELSRMKIDDIIVSQTLQKAWYFDNDRNDSMLNIPDGEIIHKDGSRIGVDISINSLLLSPKKRYQIVLRDNRERIESEKAKHEFISNISHELRSPMTNIRGYFELLMEDPVIRSKKETKEMLDVIDKNIKRLGFLIENLLKIEKKSEKKEEESSNVELFDPAVVAEDVIHMNSHLFQEKKLKVITNIERGHRVKGIRFEFSQIVSNLFINAIKYTPNGEIKVSLVSNNDKIILTIEDTGIGIPKKYINQIFDRFFRVPRESNKTIGGTGLGLSITKSLVEKMGGNIYVTSEEGKGSKFTVELRRVA